MRVSTRLENHIGSFPRIIIDQSPLMPRANVIDRQKNLPGMNGESFSANHGELQDPRQGDNILRCWGIVPIVRGVSGALLELDGHSIN